ncbi:MFS transporter [Streptosporangium sp. NPDC051022]|uniref:MFS transporter n=1 Tax=Streptosporangium sp. NPDC051022 TaxID=3155752 RepID=UPI00341FC39D
MTADPDRKDGRTDGSPGAASRWRRPEWTTVAWWRRPVGPIYLAALVLSLGKGAWFTCWAMFFIRSVGLSTAEFGIGITAAGVVGMVAGGPLGYLADRVGARETLIALGVIQGLAILSYTFVRGFWAVVAVTCVMIAAERSTPGIRIAVISGLTSGQERLDGISTTRVMTQGGIVVGAIVGGFVLSADSRAGYLALILFYGAVNLAFALLLTRVPHVESLSDRKVRRGVLVMRDRLFLLVTLLNGLLALSWGMLDSGVPLWLTAHTQAPLWVMGVLMGGNAVVIVLFQNRVSRAGATISGAGRLGLWAGIALAVSCVVFAATYHGSGAFVIAVLVVAAAVHVVGELFFVGSGFGLSVGLTPEEAHGEYQGMFATGQAAAMMLAPGVMTILLVQWGVAGWFVLAAIYLAGGVGTILAGRWALRNRHRRDPAFGVSAAGASVAGTSVTGASVTGASAAEQA